MKRWLWILLALALGAVLLLLGAVWLVSGAPMPALPPARVPAPDGFDASAFPTWGAVQSTARADVLALEDYGDPFEHYVSTEAQVTFFFLFTKAGQQRLLFVDREGDLIGEIADRPPLYPMGPWIVTPQGFYAFSETEVSELQAMDDLGTLPKSEIEHLIAQSTHYRSFASSELRAGHPDRAAGRTVHVMRHDGSWKRAASTELGYVEWRGADLHDLEAVYRVERKPASGAPENHFGSRFRVELTYFDQQEFLPRRGAPMGSTTGQGRPAQWLGTGYYTVFIDNAPALRFRLENDREILSGGAAARLVVEGGPALEFITITRNNRDATRDVILVSAG